MLPSFLIIGVQKGGTSSLFYYLSKHPMLNMPDKKELHFFDNNYSKGMRWYEGQFPSGSWKKCLHTGEASPYYIFHPLVAERVAKCLPTVKIIVLLRNPIFRAYSHYKMQENRGFDTCGAFEIAIKEEKTRLHGEVERILKLENYSSVNYQRLSYLARGNYAKQLENWLQYFPLEQFLFIQSESFFENTRKELNRVYKFLDIDNWYPEHFQIVNEGKYEDLNKKTIAGLKEYYKEQNTKLYSIINEEYNW